MADGARKATSGATQANLWKKHQNTIRDNIVKALLYKIQKTANYLLKRITGSSNKLPKKARHIQSDLSKIHAQINKTELLQQKEGELIMKRQELFLKRQEAVNLKKERKLRKLELKKQLRLAVKAKLEEQKSKKLSLSKFQDNVFLRGRAVWNDMYGSVTERNTKYFAACIFLALALLVSIIALAYMDGLSVKDSAIYRSGRGRMAILFM